MELSKRLENWQTALSHLKEVFGEQRFEMDIDNLLFLVRVARKAVDQGLIEDVNVDKENCEDLGIGNPVK